MIQVIKRVKEYDDELVYQAISECMERLSIEQDLRPGMKIVLKPNFIMAVGTQIPATTHPAVIRAVVRWLQSKGQTNITIAESSGGLYNAEHMKRVYRTCGVDTVEPMAKLNMDFSAKTVDCKENFRNKTFHIITPVAEADYVINLCKLKTHAMTGYSGGIKNLFGTIPGLEKPQLHYLYPKLEDFSNMLVELAQTVNPQVTIVDAIDAMEGDGPTGGTSHPLHLILASRDMYTQDYFATKLMGIRPEEIAMIRIAMEKGLVKPDEMELVGDEIPENLTPFERPKTASLDFSNHVPAFIAKPFVWIASRLLKSYPKLRGELCVGCGKCAESCPAHVIQIVDRKAKFKKKGCISCFCCQEMCPMKAIAVKKAMSNR